MKIKYFEDTDTLYIEFRQTAVLETKDLDEDTILDLDHDGNICAITVEHAKIYLVSINILQNVELLNQVASLPRGSSLFVLKELIGEEKHLII